MSAGARLAIGIIVGAIAALIVNVVGNELVSFHRSTLVVGLIALLIWALIAWLFYAHGRRGPVP